MPYDPNNSHGGVADIRRTRPFTAEWIGDDNPRDPSGVYNVQEYMERIRFLRGKVANIAARDLIPLGQREDGDLWLVQANDDGDPQLDMWDDVEDEWRTIAGGGSATGAYGKWEQITLFGATTDEYTLPHTGLFPMVEVGPGALQIEGEDYDLLAGTNRIKFRAGKLPPSGSKVYATALTNAFTTNSSGGGVLGVSVKLGDGDGVETDFGPLPDSGLYEFVEVGGVHQYRGTDYTIVNISGQNWVRFNAGKIPVGSIGGDPAEEVWAACAIAPLVSTDAVTLGGYPASAYLRGLASGGMTVVADIDAAKALTSLGADALVLIKGHGVGYFRTTQTDTPDDETIINVTSGGQIVIEWFHVDGVMGLIDQRVSDVEATVEEVQTALAAVVNPKLQVSGVPGGTYNAGVNLPFANTIIDTEGGYDSATGVYEVPVSGTYAVSVSVASSVAGGAVLRVEVNDATVYTGAPNQGATYHSVWNGIIALEAGDTISIASNASYNWSGGFFSLFKLPD